MSIDQPKGGPDHATQRFPLIYEVGTRCVQPVAILLMNEKPMSESTMSPNLLRCRHFQVKWISSHACQCSGCGKVGRWYEEAGLVMWTRKDVGDSTVSQRAATGNFFAYETQSALPIKAG